eukprot:1697672-Rhodomonas_salina.2
MLSALAEVNFCIVAIVRPYCPANADTSCAYPLPHASPRLCQCAPRRQDGRGTGDDWCRQKRGRGGVREGERERRRAHRPAISSMNIMEMADHPRSRERRTMASASVESLGRIRPKVG